MSNQVKGLAALLAAQGRNGDDELIHVNKREIAALERLGRRHGIATTVNPQTGLKEAFNWLSTLGGIAGGVAGTFVAPGAGTAAGAALGSAAGTAAGGGSTEEVLTNGLISGVTAYAGAGLADSLAQAGTEAGKEAAGEVVKTGIQEGITQGVTDATTQGVTQLPGAAGGFGDAGSAVVNAGGPFAGSGGLPTGAAPVTTAPVPTALPQGTPLPQGIEALNASGTQQANLALGNTPPVGEGMTPQAGSVVGDKFVQGSPSPVAEAPKMSTPGSSGQIPMGERAADYWGSVGKGIQSLDTPSKAGEFAMTNRGALTGTAMGVAGIASAPESASTDDGTSESSTSPNYRGEVYYTPYGERRTRAVPYAGGGDVYGDYDGVEDEHAAGGLAAFADGGGIGFVRSMQPGGQWGDMTADTYGAVQDLKPQWLQNIEPGGFIGATVPGKMDYEEKKRKEEEEKKRAEQELAAKQAVKMASGGISALGSYSDGGQLLRGGGDGVSDSIPASIEGRRPARLADGEFVIPARAVSELGNGSTEAGSKQLYAMLDRIAKKRKKGSGLAYQANPKKLMPV